MYVVRGVSIEIENRVTHYRRCQSDGKSAPAFAAVELKQNSKKVEEEERVKSVA